MSRPGVQSVRPDVRVFVKDRPEYADMINREAAAEARLRQSGDPVILREDQRSEDVYYDLARSACGVLILRDRCSRPRVVDGVLRFVGFLDPRARPVVFVEASQEDAGAVLEAVQGFLRTCEGRFGFWYQDPVRD